MAVGVWRGQKLLWRILREVTGLYFCLTAALLRGCVSKEQRGEQTAADLPGVEKHLCRDENISEENVCTRKTTLKRARVASPLLTRCWRQGPLPSVLSSASCPPPSCGRGEGRITPARPRAAPAPAASLARGLAFPRDAAERRVAATQWFFCVNVCK